MRLLRWHPPTARSPSVPESRPVGCWGRLMRAKARTSCSHSPWRMRMWMRMRIQMRIQMVRKKGRRWRWCRCWWTFRLHKRPVPVPAPGRWAGSASELVVHAEANDLRLGGQCSWCCAGADPAKRSQSTSLITTTIRAGCCCSSRHGRRLFRPNRDGHPRHSSRLQGRPGRSCRHYLPFHYLPSFLHPCR